MSVPTALRPRFRAVRGGASVAATGRRLARRVSPQRRARVSLVEVENLVVRYPVPRGIVGTVARRPRRTVHAVDGVSFSLQPREILALVGESGCGKTTTAQTLLRLVEPEAGSIRFEGRDVTRLSSRELRPLRRRMQLIYQDPYESLDPRLRVRQTVEVPLEVHRVGGGWGGRVRRDLVS